ncbi:MAG: type IV secretion system DNA-binding domain-containing protein [Acidobacteriaceae bacterium]|nr:type IV secretion system DNA-binding domain-containing protein [Acidobacteriaceae bacterium]
MKYLLEALLARLWNRRGTRRKRHVENRALDIGAQIVDGEPIPYGVALAQSRRAEHIAILGKTGSGKSFLLRHLATQDIESGRGFCYFDLHGDATEFLVSTVAAKERRLKEDLSDRLIVVEPADPEASVGINPLAEQSPDDRFLRVAEFAQVLRERWQLDSLGARTDELLRNSLYVLAENGLTLLESAPLLTHAAFRATCLKKTTNPEVRQYFELRYDAASEPMRATMREPILNKTSAFTGDPRFRHIVGQQHSTFSLREALDEGRWIILNLHKGRLGPQAITLGSLFLANLKTALFSRTKRDLFTLYCDEIQNLVAFGSGLETMLSESRKFGISITSANQFLDQYPPEMRAAILAVGTHIFFQLSSSDAQQIATALDGGKPLAEILKNLPRRHMVVKGGHERWREAIVPTIKDPKVDCADLLARSQRRWARTREDIEAEIRARESLFAKPSEALHEWE